MKTTWIIAADQSRIRIFETQGNAGVYEEVETFINPAGDMAPRELLSDAKGYFHGNAHGHRGGDAQPKVNAVVHETEAFSRWLSTYLDKARLERRYDKLCLIAFPKFLGLLRQNLSKESQKLVETEMSKDISWFDSHEVADYIKTRFH